LRRKGKTPPGMNDGILSRGRARALKGALGQVRLGIGTVAGIFQRGHEILIALPLEFFLRGFEVCNTHCDFFPPASEAFFLFGHADSFDFCLVPIGDRDWGTNWDAALQDCD
jgi:hypothetical protein